MHAVVSVRPIKPTLRIIYQPQATSSRPTMAGSVEFVTCLFSIVEIKVVYWFVPLQSPSPSLARSANLSIRLYILLALISFFFNRSPIISGSRLDRFSQFFFAK